MSSLNYLTEPAHNCAADNVNVLAFEQATKLIRGCDTVEEFLACSILPLSDDWDLEVKKVEVRDCPSAEGSYDEHRMRQIRF
jgi:hypothetical protein